MVASQLTAEYGWLDYVAGFGALASTALAFAALVIALRSARDSARSADAAEASADAARETARLAEESLGLARETSGYVSQQVAMQRAEHDVFLAERARRPVLEISTRVLPDSMDGRVEKTQSQTAYRQLEVAVRNEGTRTAENVSINVVAPEWLNMRWSHANGSEIAGSEPAKPSPPENVPIMDGRGVSHPTKYLDRVVNVLPATLEPAWVRFMIPPGVDSIPFGINLSHDSQETELVQFFMVTAVFTDA